jgi:Xaa-Pro aminopeptidase
MTTPVFDFKGRWEHATRLMQERGIDALFLMKPANLAYFTGDGRLCALGLFTTSLDCVVSVPTCDYRDVRATSAATDVRQFKNEQDMFHGFRDVIRQLGLAEGTIALEKNFFDAALFEVFKGHILPHARVVPATPVLSRLRMIKEPAEIDCMRAAARVAEAGMAAAKEALRSGRREIDVAGEAEYAMRHAGAEGWASATYVASGSRSAIAHGPASTKVVEDGDVVQVHLAPISRGYTVDLCRTFFIADMAAEAAEAYEAYIEAQEAGVAAARPGAPLHGIDDAMATVLKRRGYEDAFLRPVFHGVGMEHEEAPIPGGHAVIHGEEKLETVEPGMALAVGNCGIYRETFGVRAEDTVWVSERGPVALTDFPKATIG